MRAAMERREAPGLLARARAPRDPHLPRDTWVPEAWRVAGFRTPGRGGFANLLGASRRSIPLLWRGDETGDGRSRASEKQNPGVAKRWLFGSVGCLNIPKNHAARGVSCRRPRWFVRTRWSV